jgi:hypothetical protein
MEIEFLDAIITILQKDGGFLNRPQILDRANRMWREPIDLDKVDLALAKLVKDGYVHTEQRTAGAIQRQANVDSYPVFGLSYDGVLFIEQGLYAQLAERTRKEREFLDKKMELELQQITSSIRTNNSVLTVNRLFWVTLAIALIGAIGSTGTLYFQWLQDKRDQTTAKSPKNTVVRIVPNDTVHARHVK